MLQDKFTTHKSKWLTKLKFSGVQKNAVRYFIVYCIKVQYRTCKFNTEECSTIGVVQYSTVLCSLIYNCVVEYGTIQYNTVYSIIQ